MTVEVKDSHIQGILDSLAVAFNRKSAELEISRSANRKVMDERNRATEGKEEAFKTVFVLHKQLKSLQHLLAKDSLKNMNADELREVIETARLMAGRSKNIANAFITENNYNG